MTYKEACAEAKAKDRADVSILDLFGIGTANGNICLGCKHYSDCPALTCAGYALGMRCMKMSISLSASSSNMIKVMRGKKMAYGMQIL